MSLIPRMLAHLGQVLCCGALIVISPAVAADTWDCTYTAFGGPNKTLHAKFRVEREWLRWQIEGPDGIPEIQLGYRVLENNDVGVVAVSSQSWMNPHFGPTIGAGVILINKANGNLRIGDVYIVGGSRPDSAATDGQCQMN